jgi:hypothetical protein
MRRVVHRPLDAFLHMNEVLPILCSGWYQYLSLPPLQKRTTDYICGERSCASLRLSAWMEHQLYSAASGDLPLKSVHRVHDLRADEYRRWVVIMPLYASACFSFHISFPYLRIPRAYMASFQMDSNNTGSRMSLRFLLTSKNFSGGYAQKWTTLRKFGGHFPRRIKAYGRDCYLYCTLASTTK